MELSKEVMSARCIYYMSVMMGVEASKSYEYYVEKMNNNLLKLDYEEVYKLYITLKSIYNDNYIC